MDRHEALHRAGLVLLAACWIQFTSAWYWPPVQQETWGTISAWQGKLHAVPFQYSLWAALVACWALQVWRLGLTSLAALGLFVPYAAVMVTSSLLGQWPAESVRLTVQWIVCVAAGVLVASLVERGRLPTALVAVGAVTVGLSLLLYGVLPAYGTAYYGSEAVLRGVFDNKNQAGRVSALVLVVAVVFRRQVPAWLAAAAIVGAALCLLLSNSRTALVSALATLLFLHLLGSLRRRVDVALGTLAVVASVLLAGLAALWVFPLVTELLGRDATLTGRTELWETYLHHMQPYMALGAGPGSFTRMSPITINIVYELRMGNVFNAHSFLLGTLGDLGIPGLLATLWLFGWLGVVVPLRSLSPWALAGAAVSASTMLHGLAEALDAASMGISWFLLALCWAAWRLDSREAPAQAPAGPAPAGPMTHTQGAWRARA